MIPYVAYEFRSGMATLRTAIHLLLTYFLTRRIGNHEKTATFTTIMCKISSSVQYVMRMSTFKLFCFYFASLCGRTLVDDDYLVSFQHLDGAERSGCHVDCCVPATPSLDNEKTACRTRCREAITTTTTTTTRGDTFDDWDVEYTIEMSFVVTIMLMT